MTGTKAGRAVAALVSLAAFATSCTKAQLGGESSAYLIMDSLQGGSVQAAGASQPTFSGVLESDVCVHNASGGCSVFEDLGQATFQLALKDPGPSSAPTTPTTTNFITITSYHVDYTRADGRNTQGVDVPFSFDGAATVTVGSSPATVVISLVRVQAKLEAPLAALVNLGSTVSISTIATVTFYGTDQAGRAVSVVGQIGINFADWADPPASGAGS
jgi:hypothetical protein